MFPYKELEIALSTDIVNSGCIPGDMPISSDMSMKQVMCTLLSRSFYKKLAPKGRVEQADVLALEKFKDLNAQISTDTFEYPTESEQDSIFWDYFRDNFLKACVPYDVDFDLAFVRETFTAGPGSSLHCDSTSFYTKLFTSKITSTSPYLLSIYRAAISDSDTWSDAEMRRHILYGERFVEGNRLFFVPKTALISRSCCTEPLVNMLIQQAIGAFLEKCLMTSFGISLKSQPDFNRDLARIGSIDGSFGTIDLQSASDSISWALVRRICPPNLLGWLRQARCEHTILPDGTKMALNMISTMGNGFTFPLQTLIFASAVRAVYQMMSLDSHCPKTQFGVFGDDIIVRREAYDFLVRCLTKLGFKVNDDKSFNTGSFRESCGHDWWQGEFVRGVYIRSLETVSDVYSAINRLNRWSALSGVRLLNTISLLRKNVRFLRIPLSEQVDCGIKVPFKFSKPKVTDGNYWFAYRKLVNVQKKLRVPENRKESLKLGYSDFNQHGWALAFLGGFARREDVVLNSDSCHPPKGSSVRYPKAFIMPRDLDGPRRKKVVQGSIPFWDWLGPVERDTVAFEDFKQSPYDNNHSFFSYGRWEAAVAANLSL